MRPCGKHWYRTNAEALVCLAVKLATFDIPSRHLMETYFCERCEGYHMGHHRTHPFNELCVGEHK